jgi:hypothetical protein
VDNVDRLVMRNDNMLSEPIWIVRVENLVLLHESVMTARSLTNDNACTISESIFVNHSFRIVLNGARKIPAFARRPGFRYGELSKIRAARIRAQA